MNFVCYLKMEKLWGILLRYVNEPELKDWIGRILLSEAAKATESHRASTTESDRKTTGCALILPPHGYFTSAVAFKVVRVSEKMD